MRPARHAFFAVASLSLVSLVVACGGAIESPRSDDAGAGTPGSSGGIKGGGSSGTVGSCTLAPSCDSGDTRVPSESACPQDQANCYNRSACGETIWCAHTVCEGDPSCPVGYVNVPSCQGSSDCVVTNVCGQPVYCSRDLVQCDGYPACDGGDTQVASPGQCIQDDATCYQRYACGYTIWCTGPLPPDAGVVPPPPPPALPPSPKR
jgi:hypothetical protein